MMTTLEWKPEYSVGDPAIDFEHRELIGHVNDLLERIDESIATDELDAILGHLPGWYSDRHPNLAGYNVIARETAKYLAKELRKKK